MTPAQRRARSTRPRSIVLTHGYHVEAEQWQDVVWGDPRNHRLGRVPRAVLIALTQPDPLLLFGTGAAAFNNLLESEHTLHHTRTHRVELYDLVNHSLALSPEHSRQLVDELLDQRSYCERTSTTTRTEVAAALDTALLHGADHLTLVSSPTHIARCLQTALTLLATTPRYAALAGRVSAAASDTTVTGRGPGDVVVLEPQTRRADSEEPDFADVARAALPLLGQPTAATGYVREWMKLTNVWLTEARKENSTADRNQGQTMPPNSGIDHYSGARGFPRT